MSCANLYFEKENVIDGGSIGIESNIQDKTFLRWEWIQLHLLPYNKSVGFFLICGKKYTPDVF